MKKACIWVAVISAIVLFITLGVVGVKLLDGNYNTNVEVIITGVSLAIFLVSIVCYKFTINRCPHCGKVNDTMLGKSKFCPRCGKEL
jgi:rRNA maturation endonuclease Nob1